MDILIGFGIIFALILLIIGLGTLVFYILNKKQTEHDNSVIPTGGDSSVIGQELREEYSQEIAAGKFSRNDDRFLS